MAETKAKIHYLDNPPTYTYCGRNMKKVKVTVHPDKVTCKICLEYIQN